MLHEFLTEDGWRVFAVAGLTIWGGLWSYKKQKHFELVHSRYLMVGIDQVSDRAAQLINSHTQNWARALDLLKLYRDLPSEVDTLLSNVRWEDPGTGTFPFEAISRVNALIGSSVVWKGLQLLTAFAGRSYWLCTVEVPLAIKMHAEGKLTVSRAQLVEDMSNELRKLHSDADASFEVLGLVHQIARAAEDRVLTHRKLLGLSKDPNVLLAAAKVELQLRD